MRQAGGLPGVGPLGLAVAANLVANDVLVRAWRAVLRAAGIALGQRAAAWIWALSQVARYALSAAQVGGRAVVGRPYGVTPAAGALTALVEIGWQTSITALLALATVPWWLATSASLRWLAWAAVAPAAVLVAGVAAPSALLRVLAGLAEAVPFARARFARAGDALRRVDLRPAAALALTGRYALNSALRLVGVAALVGAVGGRPGDLPRVVGAYALGQLAGRLVVFAPGGLGPREGVTALVLAPAVGGGPAVVVVAAVRLCEVVAEAVTLAAARAFRPPAPTSSS